MFRQSKQYLLEQYRSTDPFRLVVGTFIGMCLYLFLAMGIGLLLIKIYGACHLTTRTFGAIVGIFSMIFNSISLLPQIYKTYKSKSVGNFSILMVMIQAPGAVTYFIFMAFISHEAATTWLSYLSSAVLQFSLLALLLKYKNNDDARKRALTAVDNDGWQSSSFTHGNLTDATESTPLLPTPTGSPAPEQ